MARKRAGAWKTFGLFCIGVLMVAAGLWFVSDYPLPDGEDLPGMVQSVCVQDGCVQLQTLNYQRCGHQVVRTVDAPTTWLGLERGQVEALLGMSWRVTDFAPQRLVMQRNVMLFCPQHWVLMPDEAGRVCIWVNRYGEGMEQVYETNWRLVDLPEAEQEQVRIGKGFELLEEAEGFLEALES